MGNLIADEDGAPYPEVYAVYDRSHDPVLYLPYPGGLGTGSKEAADSVVNPNKHLGLIAVRCQLVPVDASKDEHGWCFDCPDKEACMTGYTCDHVKKEAERAAAARTSEG